jgi:hypothetical protein
VSCGAAEQRDAADGARPGWSAAADLGVRRSLERSDVKARVLRLLIRGPATIVISSMILVSLDRTTYSFRRLDDRLEWRHPTVGVAVMAGLTIAEAVIVLLVFERARRRRLWASALIGLAILVPWGCALGLAIIHGPGFYIVHFLWVWVLIAVLAITVLVSGGAHASDRLRRRAGTSSERPVEQ